MSIWHFKLLCTWNEGQKELCKANITIFLFVCYLMLILSTFFSNFELRGVAVNA